MIGPYGPPHNILMNTLLPIAHQFAEAVRKISALGNGLINDTFLVTTEIITLCSATYKSHGFPAPNQIMDNLITLNRHLNKNQGLGLSLNPGYLKTTSNHDFYQDEEGDYWRALDFIGNTECLETISSLSQAQQTGFALGHFHHLVSDLDPSLLHDTLPGFHNCPRLLKPLSTRY